MHENIYNIYKLVDTDAQCNSTKFYEASTQGKATMLDILCGDEPALNCVQHTSKGDIIASDKLLSEAENRVCQVKCV